MFSFSYSVTRQYPYRWFTPTAIVGGIILAVLFSAINFFSNAYNMVTITTQDPNGVEANRWSGHVPAIFTSKIQPKCQDAIIPVGSIIFTNQTALLYQLNKVEEQALPAVAYHNQPLFGCEIEQIMIDFQNNNAQQAVLVNRSAWRVTVNAQIVCALPGEGNLVVIDLPTLTSRMGLSVQYDPLSSTGKPGVSRFLRVNVSPAWAWAETLLLGFWTECVTAITHQTAQQPDPSDSDSSWFNLSSGYITFEQPQADIKSALFFEQGQYAFFDSDSNGFTGSFRNRNKTTYGTLITNASWPNVWAPAGRLARAMFSVINADLGQTSNQGYAFDVSDTGPSFTVDLSMLTSPDRLHHWTENLTRIWDASTVLDKDSLSDGLQMTQYNTTSDSAPYFTYSEISATYTCQVPHLKSGFNVFISILVADIVLLRVAWTLYNFIVCYFLKDRHPDANLCLRCLERGRNDDAGMEEFGIADTSEDTGYHGQVIELDDLGRDHEERVDQQSLQKLLIRKPVGS
jgi:hypothetical protein